MKGQHVCVQGTIHAMNRDHAVPGLIPFHVGSSLDLFQEPSSRHQPKNPTLFWVYTTKAQVYVKQMLIMVALKGKMFLTTMCFNKGK